ncbi:MAG: SapC family protein [Porticoccaceae bacterium]
MARIKPLRTDTDGQCGWKPYADYYHAAHETVLPVALAELSQSLTEYTLAFARLPGDAYSLVALMGLRPGENLFVNQAGMWCARYVPAQLRSYPFILAKKPDDAGQSLVCFDHDSGLYRREPDMTAGEQRFFDAEGKPQPFFDQVIGFLKARQNNLVLTQRGVDAIVEHDLLLPWLLPAAAEGEEPLRGFYRFNEEKFNSLDADTLQTLRNANALTVAFAQLFSMPRIAVLLQMAKARATHKPISEADIESIFGETDDTLDFNFL